MLSIGGNTDKIKSVDAAPQGLLIFDMTAHAWKDSYDAKAKNYSRAPIVEAWYQDGLVSSYHPSNAMLAPPREEADIAQHVGA